MGDRPRRVTSGWRRIPMLAALILLGIHASAPAGAQTQTRSPKKRAPKIVPMIIDGMGLNGRYR